MAINPNAVADQVLKRKPAGAEVLVRVRISQTGHTRFARSEITSTGDVDGVGVTVEVAYGKRIASADGNQTDPASLRGLVERAARLAKLAPENPEKMPLLGPQKYVNAPAAFDGGGEVSRRGGGEGRGRGGIPPARGGEEFPRHLHRAACDARRHRRPPDDDRAHR